MAASAMERFMAQVMCDPNSGCWLWTGTLQPRGYANFALQGRTVLGHRFAYEMLRGEIPSGLQLDHLCRVRSCVNPDHLEPVTSAVNCRRGESRAAQNARKTHCIYGHEFSPANTYRHGGKRKCRTCAIAYALRSQHNVRQNKTA